MRTVVVLVLVIAAAGGIWFASSREPDPTSTGPGEPSSDDGAIRQTSQSYLTEEQRLELFDLERADLLLGKALSPWTKALKAARTPDVLGALMTGFRADVPDLEHLSLAPEPGRPFAQAEPPVRAGVDKAGFERWLADVYGRFGKLEAFKFGRKFNSKEILDPTKMAKSKGTFRIAGLLKGGGRMEIAGNFELGHRGLESGNIPTEDWIDSLTLYDVRVVASSDVFFRDVTSATGIRVDALHDNWKSIGEPNGYHVHTGGVFLGDVNMDSHLDVVLTNPGRAWLYFGNGTGIFRESSWAPTTPTDRVSYAAIFDATGDGNTEVMLNGALFRFDPKTESMRPMPGATKLPYGDLVLGDYDRDGLVDVYVLESGGPPSGARTRAFFDDKRITGRANQLFRNLGDGQFEDVTDQTNASGDHGRTFAAFWLYANEDDLPDLIAVNEFGKNAYLIQQPDGTFKDAPLEGDAFGGYSMGAVAGDLDGNGRVDVYVSNMYSKAGHRVFHHLPLEIYPVSVRNMFRTSVEGNKYYRNRGDGTFEDVSLKARVNVAGWGWGGNIIDVDLDGWLDLYATCGHRSEDASRPDG